MRLFLPALACALSIGSIPSARSLIAPQSAPQASAGAGGEADLAGLVDASALVYVDLAGVAPVLKEGLGHPLIERLLDSDLVQTLLAQAPMTPEEALSLGQVLFGRPVLPTLAALTDEGLEFALGIKRGEPAYLLAARGSDAGLTRQVLEEVLSMVAEEHGADVDSFSEPHGSVRGLDTWYLGDEFALSIADGLLLISNDEGMLRDAIDRLIDGQGTSLLDNEGFRSARREHRQVAQLAWSWVDIDALEALDASATQDLRSLARSAPAHFLFGPAIASIGAAGQTTLALRLADTRIELVLEAAGIEGDPAARVLPKIGAAAAQPFAPSAEGAARGLFYRDLVGLFQNRTELFPAAVLPQFAEVTSNLALFFGGADISDEVLPALSPWIDLVVDEPLFLDGAVPDLPLPGAALVVLVDNASKVGPLLVGAFQTAIGIINVQGAQEMQPQLLLNLELVEGVTLTSAHFPLPGQGQGVDMRYNLEPACALVGDRFVLGSHRSLVAELVRRLKGGAADLGRDGATAGPSGERLRIAGSAFAKVIRANAAALELNAVLEEGKDPEVARGEIEALALVGELVQQLTLSTKRLDSDRVRVALVLDLAE